jgi:hypothetical protein
MRRRSHRQRALAVDELGPDIQAIIGARRDSRPD